MHPQESDASTICIQNLADLPTHWRPLPGLFPENGKPWTKEEQALADEAVQKGLDELVTFYQQNLTKSRIRKLRTNAVNSLIDEAYASSNMPAFHEKALRAAATVLKINAKPFLLSPDEEAECEKMYEQLKYVGYGQYLVTNLPDDHELARFHDQLVMTVNAVVKKCESLENLIELKSITTIFKEENAHADDVFEWVLSAIALTDCLTVPKLILPTGTEEFIANVWTYLKTYHYPYARDQFKHFSHRQTRNTAWLATHVAYVPSGYGRHKQRIDDAPFLYKYVRENLYYALEYGMLDLFCEFVDLVRQYGCTEENDYQVRHGSRYILSLYKKGGHSWMNYKEDWENGEEEIEDYSLIHKPWTAISGLIRRKFEPIIPGSYGYAFNQALEKAKTKSKHKKSLRKQRKSVE